ncbi:MAG: glucokinase, family [Oscillospiraceae bacterium]|nr:glucokinase, family [Oscillospiraceae bacterium]
MYRIGIDVGGTNLAGGVLDDAGRLLSKVKLPVDPSRSDVELCADLIRLSQAVTAQAGLSPEAISGIGIGIPGSVDRKNGIILFTPNAAFQNTPVRDLFQTVWNIPVALGNDANCAALGEYHAGNAKDCESVVVVTLGTGVGVGVILRGEVFLGFNGSGMEGGHTVIVVDGQPCNCGRKGCWEQYASATALKRMTREAMEQTPDSLMWKFCDNHNVSGRTPFQAARVGDTAGRGVVDRYLHYVAVGLTNLVNLFQPEVLCLGGGVSNEEDEDFLFPLREMVYKEHFARGTQLQPKLVKASLGNDAGIIGAAFLIS